MKLVVGLGNPGPKYALTRHNVGFMVVDALAIRHGIDGFRTEHKALTGRLKINNQPVLLAKPQTFMNLSGGSVRSLLDYYQISYENLLVLHDDIDQPFASFRLQKNRGHGGHNGIRSIHETLASNDYARLKIGVGRPSHLAMDVADYVLQNFSTDEQKQLPELLSWSCEVVEAFWEKGFDKAANEYNQRKKP